MRKFLAHTITVLAALVLAAGCASTTLQSEWRDPAYTGGPFRKIFVIGLSARDITARRIFEEARGGFHNIARAVIEGLLREA